MGTAEHDISVFLVVMGLIFPIAVLIAGIVLLNISSDKAVEHSVHFASALGVSSLMIGLVLVSIGTDLPEMANSIVSCWSGHGDINLGDSVGSVLTQITLVLGLIAFLGRSFKVKRIEVLSMGFFQVLALALTVLVALTGFTRLKAFLLIASWPIFVFIIRRIVAKDLESENHVTRETKRHYLIHGVIAVLGFLGVAIGAFAVVQSIIMLSRALGVAEFYISFFALAIGTSLPELVVDLAAIRKGQVELALGDIIGSCIVDATVSVSIGQLFFPAAVFTDPSGRSISLALYAIFASTVVIIALASRKQLDKKAGALFLALYSTSYLLLYV